MSGFIWLSYPLSEKTPAYGGGEGLKVKTLKNIQQGDSCNNASWQLPNHLGTHVDAPRHFFAHGQSLDQFPPSFWVFSRVAIMEAAPDGQSNLIEKEAVLSSLTGDPELLLLITKMGERRGRDDYITHNPGLSPELAPALKNNYPSLRAVGIDSISISSWQNRQAGREAHRAFLNPHGERPLLLIEDMFLAPLREGVFISRVFVLPMLVENADGAPCTVLAELH